MVDSDFVVLSDDESSVTGSNAGTGGETQVGPVASAEQTSDEQPLLQLPVDFDPREAIAEFVEDYLLKHPSPEFDNNLLIELDGVLRSVAVKFKFKKDIEKITEEDMDKISLLLYWIALIKKEELAQEKHNIKGKLQEIGDPSYNFPEEQRRIAQAFSKEFEADNWGVPPEPKRPTKATRVTTRSRERSGERKPIKAKAEKSEAVVRYPPKDHKIFGSEGCMHHIPISQSKYTKAYILDDAYAQKDFRTFGHNGLEVGTCWPLQVAAWRDGAHGSRMGGISGTADRGCYSIVVSGAYKGLDRDTGDILYYTTANAHDAADKNINTKENGFTKSLIRSIETTNPVRVLRTSKGDWAGAPRIGMRYDGLYKVLSYTASKSEEKGHI
ncbi:PUA-like domain-containing protein [Halenospora varia]|nr:PUA-like domain-containing protein [Halenospora varia]